MIVALVITLNIIFTAAVLTVFCITGNEPTELVIAWFSFTTVELWQCAKIRRDKLKNEIPREHQKGEYDNHGRNGSAE